MSDDMTMQHLRELMAKATPEPWCMCDGHLECREVCDVGLNEVHAPSSPFNRGDDAPLIVAMRNALPDLLDRLDALKPVELMLREWVNAVDDGDVDPFNVQGLLMESRKALDRLGKFT